VTGLIWIIMTL